MSGKHMESLKEHKDNENYDINKIPDFVIASPKPKSTFL